MGLTDRRHIDNQVLASPSGRYLFFVNEREDTESSEKEKKKYSGHIVEIVRP
jgi:hypothetical protein